MSYFDLLSGRYLKDLPDDKAYLYKYFQPGVQRVFLHYFLSFGNYTQFKDHTGYDYTKRWREKLRLRLLLLLKIHKQAQDELDFDLLYKIEQGDYNIYDIEKMSKNFVWTDFLNNEDK